MSDTQFEYLLGKTILKIDINKVMYDDTYDNDIIYFYLSNFEVYEMTHNQDCCEEVSIEDIDGDLEDLIGVPLLQAEERSNEDNSGEYESATWTFYKLATKKGYVTIRWFGSSNGYYSEGVDFYKSNIEFPLKLIRKGKLNNINKK